MFERQTVQLLSEFTVPLILGGMKYSILSLIFLLGCNGGGGSGSSGVEYARLKPDCFQARTSPIIEKGDLLTGSTWNDPSVIKEGNTFVMYASSDNNFDGDIKIYRMTSTNGYSFSLNPSTPVLTHGSSSDWDYKSVETPSVVKFNGTYYMFYTGYPTTSTDAKTYKIGVATSSDGISWTKGGVVVAPSDPTNTTPSLQFNQWVTAEPAAVVFNNKIYLYYSALGASSTVNTTWQTIGLVTSSDGATWTSQEQTLVPDLSIYPRASWKGYTTPAAYVLDGKMHLFFAVLNDVGTEHPEKIHHAYSTDGKTNWTHDSSAIFDRSEFSPWADQDLRAPAVDLTGKNLRLWFAGNGDTSGFPNVNMGIGYSNCAL